jgi:N-acetylmuramoyl-L-alanine amidase
METWVPLQRWSRASNQAVLMRLASSSTPSYTLQSTNGVFFFRTGSLLGQWEGIEVRLGFAPQQIDGQPFVHALDLKKTIQPLLQGEGVPILNQSPVVVIDPGHGGENAGTKSVLGNHYEKEFTLDWALRLQALLISNNCRAFLTRSNDSDLALSNRVAFASLQKADVFVSLHFNSAAPNEAEAGLETYCLTPAGMPSNLTRGFPDEIHQTYPNNAFDVQNLFLALRVHRALLQINGHHDRGVRRARFPGVLRGQQRAAILVEGGYLSNPQEARLIGQPSYRQRLAEAVAAALLQKPATSSGAVALNTSTAQFDPKSGPALANDTAAQRRLSTDSSQGAASPILTEEVKVRSTELPENKLQQP